MSISESQRLAQFEEAQIKRSAAEKITLSEDSPLSVSIVFSGIKTLRLILGSIVGDIRAGKSILSLIEYGYASVGNIKEQDCVTLVKRLRAIGLNTSVRPLGDLSEGCVDLRITL